MILRITCKNHITSLSYFLITTLGICLVGFYYFNFSFDLIIVGLLFQGIFVIPSFYLHLEYWFKNSSESYEIFWDRIFFENEKEKKEYLVSDIENIILYKSANLDKNGFQIIPIDSYHYARIYLKSGEELIITSLLTPKVEEAIRILRGVKIERKKRPFCTIFWK